MQLIDKEGRPVRSPEGTRFETAVRSTRSLQDAEMPGVHEHCRTVLLSHGKPTERSFVLFHGYTNCPRQWRCFAESLYERGCNVLIPLLPRHGGADRQARRLAGLTEEELMAATDAAIETGRGLGRRVTVAGFSLGGVLAAWAAMQRYDLEHAMLVAPAFSYRVGPAWTEPCLATLMGWLPDLFLWWDRNRTTDGMPEHAYPQFSTRGLWQIRRIARRVFRLSRQGPPRARKVTVALNEADRTVRNGKAVRLAALWQRRGHERIRLLRFPCGLGLLHDLIDPAQPWQKVALSYPRLLEAALRED